jgi:hypothetical protein
MIIILGASMTKAESVGMLSSGSTTPRRTMSPTCWPVSLGRPLVVVIFRCATGCRKDPVAPAHQVDIFGEDHQTRTVVRKCVADSLEILGRNGAAGEVPRAAPSDAASHGQHHHRHRTAKQTEQAASDRSTHLSYASSPRPASSSW